MKLNNKLETNVEKDLLYFKYNTSDRLSTVSDHLDAYIITSIAFLNHFIICFKYPRPSIKQY